MRPLAHLQLAALDVKNLNRMGIGYDRNRLWALFVMGYGCAPLADSDFFPGVFLLLALMVKSMRIINPSAR